METFDDISVLCRIICPGLVKSSDTFNLYSLPRMLKVQLTKAFIDGCQLLQFYPPPDVVEGGVQAIKMMMRLVCKKCSVHDPEVMGLNHSWLNSGCIVC